MFDSCHSGTLLDLKHFRCNRVYVPWLNKGNRRTNSNWNSNKRMFARTPYSTLPNVQLLTPMILQKFQRGSALYRA